MPDREGKDLDMVPRSSLQGLEEGCSWSVLRNSECLGSQTQRHLLGVLPVSVPTDLINVYKFYTYMISGEKECTPKSAWILSKLEMQQITITSKVYTKVPFIKISKNYPFNTPIKLSNYFCPSFPGTFTQKVLKNVTKKRIYDKTPYVKSNQFTPTKKIVHLRCRWCRRHLEGLCANPKYLPMHFFTKIFDKKKRFLRLLCDYRYSGPESPGTSLFVAAVCTYAVHKKHFFLKILFPPWTILAAKRMITISPFPTRSGTLSKDCIWRPLHIKCTM